MEKGNRKSKGRRLGERKKEKDGERVKMEVPEQQQKRNNICEEMEGNELREKSEGTKRRGEKIPSFLF